MKNLIFYGQDYSKITDNIGKTKQLDEKFEELKGNDRFPDEILKNILQNLVKKWDERIKGDTDRLILNNREKIGTRKIGLMLDEDRFNGCVGVIYDVFTLDTLDEFIDEKYRNNNEEINVKLQLTSRFDTLEKPYFLYTMLMGKNMRMSDTYTPSNSDDELSDILLLSCFAKQFEDAYCKGYYRTYHNFIGNDEKLKGSIDFSKHIKLNMGLNTGKISYSYREKSINNYLNHLIIEALLYLTKKNSSLVESFFEKKAELYQILKNLQYEIDYPLYDTKTVFQKNLLPLTHPYYTEYERLRKTCIKILRDESISFFDGTEEETQTVLYYIPYLWEEYLYDMFNERKNNSPREGFILNVEEQREVKVFSPGDPEKSRWETTYPDFVFYENDSKKTPYMVLDAKFKPKWGNIIKGYSITGDLLDDFDKCIRDAKSLNCNATGVIFPTNPTNNNNCRINDNRLLVHNISIHNKIDRFFTIPVYVPKSNGKSYQTWLNDFDAKLADSLSKLETFAANELRYFLQVRALKQQMADIRVNYKYEEAE